LNNAVRGAFASSIAVLRNGSREGNSQWQQILTTMSKSFKKDKMIFDFEAGDGWDHLSAERAAEMISHLAPSTEELEIQYAPYGSPFIDALIEWVKNATNLKRFTIRYTFVGNTDGGRDAGVRLAEALAGNKSTIEKIQLQWTDLIGSRNINEWSEALRKMTLLKRLDCYGMRRWIKKVDGSSLDVNSTLEWSFDKRQRIYWKDGSLPDATMAYNDKKKLEEATKAGKVDIRHM